MSSFIDNFQIVGHRGFRGRYPENTLQGFEKAVQAGATMVELDVQLTKDDTVVVVHDLSMERLSSDPRHVTDMTWDEFKKLSIHDETYDHNLSGSPCRLEDLFKTLKGRVHYYIEIKSSEQQGDEYKRRLCDKVLALVKKYGLLDSVMFASFEMQSVEILRELEPNVPMGLNVRYFLPSEMTLKRLEKLKVGINPDQALLDKEKIQSYQKRGFRVMPWGVNDTQRMKQMIKWGVNAITTDFPDLLFGVLKNK